MTEQTDDRVLADAAAAGSSGSAGGDAQPAESADVAPLAADTTDRRVMVCPVCGYANLQGDDLCANCGADLMSSDIPQATTPFERLLVDVPLGALKTRPPFTVEASTPVADVVARMRSDETADVLIIEDGRLVGIFTERDVALKLAGPDALGGDAGAGPISGLMTGDPVVLRSTDSIAVAVQKMAVGGFRHIPLVRDGQPIGVVSAADIFRHILRVVE